MKSTQNKNYEATEKELQLYNEYESNIYNEKIKNIHKLAAILLQPHFDKAQFSIGKSNILADKLLNCKVYEVFIIAFFLILKYDPQLINRIKFYQGKALLMYLSKLKSELKS